MSSTNLFIHTKGLRLQSWGFTETNNSLASIFSLSTQMFAASVTLYVDNKAWCMRQDDLYSMG